MIIIVCELAESGGTAWKGVWRRGEDLIDTMGLGVQDWMNWMNWIFHWDPELYTRAHAFARPVLSVSVGYLSTSDRSLEMNDESRIVSTLSLSLT